jgi:hypothetical protein
MLHITHPHTLIMPVGHITLVILVVSAIGWALTELLPDLEGIKGEKNASQTEVYSGIG